MTLDARVHDLKTWPEPFAAIRAGSKPFEIRFNDRDFRVGDLLLLREYDPETRLFSEQSELRAVTYVLPGPCFGIEAGYVALGLHTEDAARLRELLNTPELHDFARGAVLEAAHQRQRWGADHDDGKSPLDWFWLIGFLAQKAATAAMAGDVDKAKHHTISTGAALANWHANLSGSDTTMRPGIATPAGEEPA